MEELQITPRAWTALTVVKRQQILDEYMGIKSQDRKEYIKEKQPQMFGRYYEEE